MMDTDPFSDFGFLSEILISFSQHTFMVIALFCGYVPDISLY